MQVFSETQRFTQWFMKIVYVGMFALLMFCLYDLSISQANVEKTIGNLICVFTAVGALALFYYLELRTQIDERGIHYQFFPFQFKEKTITWSQILQCNVRTYNPLKEYGGWGYKTSFGKGKAFNVRGNLGIQLVLKNGEKILIGTQQGEKTQQVINRYFNKNEGI